MQRYTEKHRFCLKKPVTINIRADLDKIKNEKGICLFMTNREKGWFVHVGNRGKPMTDKPKYAWAKALSDAVNLATTAAASVGICLFAGWWLDRRFDTEPWFVALGALLGVATAIKAMWDKMMVNTKRRESSDLKDKEKNREN